MDNLTGKESAVSKAEVTCASGMQQFYEGGWHLSTNERGHRNKVGFFFETGLHINLMLQYSDKCRGTSPNIINILLLCSFSLLVNILSSLVSKHILYICMKYTPTTYLCAIKRSQLSNISQNISDS